MTATVPSGDIAPADRLYDFTGDRFRSFAVVLEVLHERERQVRVEGWTPAHDAERLDGSLGIAAAALAMPSCSLKSDLNDEAVIHGLALKPKDRRRDLVRAAALIVAEIERLDRALAPGHG